MFVPLPLQHGNPQFTTKYVFGISIPRCKTSVATKTLIVSLRNSEIIASLSAAVKSPLNPLHSNLP